jgi:hypothetical protein
LEISEELNFFLDIWGSFLECLCVSTLWGIKHEKLILTGKYTQSNLRFVMKCLRLKKLEKFDSLTTGFALSVVNLVCKCKSTQRGLRNLNPILIDHSQLGLAIQVIVTTIAWIHTRKFRNGFSHTCRMPLLHFPLLFEGHYYLCSRCGV